MPARDLAGAIGIVAALEIRETLRQAIAIGAAFTGKIDQLDMMLNSGRRPPEQPPRPPAPPQHPQPRAGDTRGQGPEEAIKAYVIVYPDEDDEDEDDHEHS